MPAVTVENLLVLPRVTEPGPVGERSAKLTAIQATHAGSTRRSAQFSPATQAFDVTLPVAITSNVYHQD